MVTVKLVGIVDEYLFIHPFYAGDSIHGMSITEATKRDLVERGVKVYDDIDDIKEAVFPGTKASRSRKE